jgi:hypothetical protein
MWRIRNARRDFGVERNAAKCWQCSVNCILCEECCAKLAELSGSAHLARDAVPAIMKSTIRAD